MDNSLLPWVECLAKINNNNNNNKEADLWLISFLEPNNNSNLSNHNQLGEECLEWSKINYNNSKQIILNTHNNNRGECSFPNSNHQWEADS